MRAHQDGRANAVAVQSSEVTRDQRDVMAAGIAGGADALELELPPGVRAQTKSEAAAAKAGSNGSARKSSGARPVAIRPRLFNLTRFALVTATAIVAMATWTAAPLFAVWVGSHAQSGQLVSMWGAVTVIAVLLASGTTRWRRALFALWGLVAGLLIWDHWLVLPFLAAAFGLLLVFCRAELRGRAGLLLGAGVLVGAAPLLVHNLTAPFSENSVLVFLRRYQNETILCVNNLSRYAQAVELDMSEFNGCVPVELWGERPFPAIGDLPYLLTLGPHGVFWFRLARRESIAGS
jgi:hypothetical protein